MSKLGLSIDKQTGIPAHTQVRARITELIRDDHFRPGDKLPGEPEIAAMLGVSRMTANKALLQLVSEGVLTREKGRGTFVATPYKAIRKCTVLTQLEPESCLEDYYVGALYWHIYARMAERGIQTQFVQLRGPVPFGLDQGIIAITPPSRARIELEAIARSGCPVVQIGSHWLDSPVHSVDSDNVLGVSLAVDHLVRQGHERIGFLGGMPEASNTQDRVVGFRNRLQAHDRPVLDEHIHLVTAAVKIDDDTEATVFSRLRQDNAPTAFIVGGPHLTIRFLAAAHRRGISVPGELSIVGYDDPVFMGLAFPSLTTIRQPLEAMAAEACEILLSQSRNRSFPSHRSVLPPELVIRESTAPVSAPPGAT